MATCKDCVHVEVCKEYHKMFWESKSLVDSKIDETEPENCLYFKDRSRFVELPCKVGDKLYFNNVHLQYAKVLAIYIDAVGGMFDLDITTKEETVAGYEHFINKDYSFEDIGKRIFLTKEQAEQALKEREDNV